jgi:hypothetical protein
MAHAQKPDFVFRRRERVHLNRRGRQFSRLLAVEVCASAVIMLDTARSEVVWRVLATQSIRQFPLHFPSRASPCVITFQLDSTRNISWGEKAAGALGWQPYHLHVLIVLKSGSLKFLESSGLVQACGEITLPLSFFYQTSQVNSVYGAAFH